VGRRLTRVKPPQQRTSWRYRGLARESGFAALTHPVGNFYLSFRYEVPSRRRCGDRATARVTVSVSERCH